MKKKADAVQAAHMPLNTFDDTLLFLSRLNEEREGKRIDEIVSQTWFSRTRMFIDVLKVCRRVQKGMKS